MTLSGARRVHTGNPTSIRLAAFVNMALGVLTIGCIALATDRLSALWSAGFVGIGLLVLGGAEAWAAHGGHLRGTKLLAMFMTILGMVLVGTAWIIPQPGIYRAATTLVGILIIGVSLVDALISPDEDRRAAFEPRGPDDLAPPPAP